MSLLELAYADGQLAAMLRHKMAWPSATHPVVQQSATLKSQPPAAVPPLPPPPATPETVKQTFNLHEQGETRVEPRRKLSEALCTTCRQAKHYGPCKRPIKIPEKKAGFNLGMTADDADVDEPSTSPHYHSATTADSSLARARDGRPADEQAASAFADLFRHLGITDMTDEPGNTYEGLSKVSQFMIGPGEVRGPSLNPYEERLTIMSPPVGQGDVGEQRIQRAFDQIDGAADSTSIEDTAKGPTPGPLA